MRGLPHTAENFKIEIFEARFLNCSDPVHADPKFGNQKLQRCPAGPLFPTVNRIIYTFWLSVNFCTAVLRPAGR